MTDTQRPEDVSKARWDHAMRQWERDHVNLTRRITTLTTRLEQLTEERDGLRAAHADKVRSYRRVKARLEQAEGALREVVKLTMHGDRTATLKQARYIAAAALSTGEPTTCPRCGSDDPRVFLGWCQRIVDAIAEHGGSGLTLPAFHRPTEELTKQPVTGGSYTYQASTGDIVTESVSYGTGEPIV